MNNSTEQVIASALALMGKTAPEQQQQQKKKKPGRKPSQPEPNYPADPIVIQKIDKPRTYVNHSYRDFSQVPPETNELMNKAIADTFSQKLFQLLSDEEEAQRCITWNPHGRSFRILVPKRLEQSMLLQKYFGHNRYSSFLRQLTNYGFKHITKGIDRNSYYHECFLQGLPHLLKYMPDIRDIRRQIADPDNEPDFYEISKRFPVSKQKTCAVNHHHHQHRPVVDAPVLLKHPAPAIAPQLLFQRPSAVSMALALSSARPPHDTRLQLLRLLHEQEQRKKALLTSLLLRNPNAMR